MSACVSVSVCGRACACAPACAWTDMHTRWRYRLRRADLYWSPAPIPPHLSLPTFNLSLSLSLSVSVSLFSLSRSALPPLSFSSSLLPLSLSHTHSFPFRVSLSPCSYILLRLSICLSVCLGGPHYLLAPLREGLRSFVYSKHPFRPRGDRGGPMRMSRRNQKRRCCRGAKEVSRQG